MTANAFTTLRQRSQVEHAPSASQIAAAVMPMSDASRRCPAAHKEYWSFPNAKPVASNGRAPCPVCGRSIALSGALLGDGNAKIPVHHKTKPAKSEH